MCNRVVRSSRWLVGQPFKLNSKLLSLVFFRSFVRKKFHSRALLWKLPLQLDRRCLSGNIPLLNDPQALRETERALPYVSFSPRGSRIYFWKGLALSRQRVSPPIRKIIFYLSRDKYERISLLGSDRITGLGVHLDRRQRARDRVRAFYPIALKSAAAAAAADWSCRDDFAIRGSCVRFLITRKFSENLKKTPRNLFAIIR